MYTTLYVGERVWVNKIVMNVRAYEDFGSANSSTLYSWR